MPPLHFQILLLHLSPDPCIILQIFSIGSASADKVKPFNFFPNIPSSPWYFIPPKLTSRQNSIFPYTINVVRSPNFSGHRPSFWKSLYRRRGMHPVSLLTFFFAPQIAIPKYCRSLSETAAIFLINSSYVLQPCASSEKSTTVSSLYSAP